MHLPNSTTPGFINMNPPLGTEEEIGAFIGKLQAAASIHDAKANELPQLGGHEETPAQEVLSRLLVELRELQEV